MLSGRSKRSLLCSRANAENGSRCATAPARFHRCRLPPAPFVAAWRHVSSSLRWRRRPRRQSDADLLAAKAAFDKSDRARLAAVAPKLASHVLAPYVGYWQLKLALDEALAGSGPHVLDTLSRTAARRPPAHRVAEGRWPSEDSGRASPSTIRRPRTTMSNSPATASSTAGSEMATRRWRPPSRCGSRRRPRRTPANRCSPRCSGAAT